MTEAVNRDFKVDENNTLHIFKPIAIGGQPALLEHYIAKFKSENDPTLVTNELGQVFAKSKKKPLVLWGPHHDEFIPGAWAYALDTCAIWELNSSKLLVGSYVTVRIGIFDVNHPVDKSIRQGKTLLGVHVHQDEPSKEALEWLAAGIVERKSWFS